MSDHQDDQDMDAVQDIGFEEDQILEDKPQLVDDVEDYREPAQK